MVRDKALQIKDKQPYIDALNEIKKINPNRKKVALLIDTYNELKGYKLFHIDSFFKCGDCRRNIKNFWTNIVNEWSK